MPLVNNVATTGKWVKIGTLLLKAGLIEPEQFTQSLERSKKEDALLGNILVRMGALKHEELAAALYLQSLVAEGVLEPQLAVTALRAVHEQGATAQGALHMLGWKAAITPQVDEIEHLLTEAGFVSRQLYYSIAAASKSAFSLVLKGSLRCQQFNEVLKAVSLVRAGVCNLDQATIALQAYRTSAIPIEETLCRNFGLSVRGTSLRLGELLVHASIINEADMLMALELSLRTHKKLGACLQPSAALPDGALDICLEIQELASTGVLQADVAAKIAKHCIELRETLAQYFTRTKALFEPPATAARMVDVLKKAQIISDEDLLEAHQLTRKYGFGPIAALAATHRIDRATYSALWYFNHQLEKEEIRLEQAVVAMLWCQRTGGSPEDALRDTSGKFRRLSIEEKEQQAVDSESSRLQRLNAESLRLHRILNEEKTSNDKEFFLVGVFLTTGVLCVGGFMLPQFALYIGVLAVVIGAAAVTLVFKRARASKQGPDAEQQQLNEISAVRRKQQVEAQTSIAS